MIAVETTIVVAAVGDGDVAAAGPHSPEGVLKPASAL
jgi:hypothetical protein